MSSLAFRSRPSRIYSVAACGNDSFVEQIAQICRDISWEQSVERCVDFLDWLVSGDDALTSTIVSMIDGRRTPMFYAASPGRREASSACSSSTEFSLCCCVPALSVSGSDTSNMSVDPEESTVNCVDAWVAKLLDGKTLAETEVVQLCNKVQKWCLPCRFATFRIFEGSHTPLLLRSNRHDFPRYH